MLLDWSLLKLVSDERTPENLAIVWARGLTRRRLTDSDCLSLSTK